MEGNLCLIWAVNHQEVFGIVVDIQVGVSGDAERFDFQDVAAQEEAFRISGDDVFQEEELMTFMLLAIRRNTSGTLMMRSMTDIGTGRIAVLTERSPCLRRKRTARFRFRLDRNGKGWLESTAMGVTTG